MDTSELQHDVPLAPYTTLGLGGPAKHFARIQSVGALQRLLRWAGEQGVPGAILGGGSNLIVPDAGYEGLVVHVAIPDLDFSDDGVVRAGAGVPWEQVVDGAVARGWAGLECLTGIPGSTGATPIQNVGAYGQEVGEVITAVEVLRRDTLEPDVLAPSACAFSYRDSALKRDPDRFVVTGVTFRLRPGGAPTVIYPELAGALGSSASLDDVRRAVRGLRRKKSMLLDPDDPNRRSAGSFFLNPVLPDADADRVIQLALDGGLAETRSAVPAYPAGDGTTKLAAGWLIEKAGVDKGMREGAFGVSTRHALAIVHHGGGSTAELLAFASGIATRVEDRFGVRLEREPRLLQ